MILFEGVCHAQDDLYHKLCKFHFLCATRDSMSCLHLCCIFIIVYFVLDIYRETIPSNAPPSYRGQCIKYAYKITVGTQRVNAVIKLLKIPIRVLVLCGKYMESCHF